MASTNLGFDYEVWFCILLNLLPIVKLTTSLSVLLQPNLCGRKYWTFSSVSKTKFQTHVFAIIDFTDHQGYPIDKAWVRQQEVNEDSRGQLGEIGSSYLS